VVVPGAKLPYVGDVDAQTRFEAASKSLMIHLSQEVTHLGSREYTMQQMELMDEGPNKN
ncbi:hypothetical protein Tco_0470427, partial [Tanacetum coccineum]